MLINSWKMENQCRHLAMEKLLSIIN